MKIKLERIDKEKLSIVQEILDAAPFYHLKTQGLEKLENSAMDLFEEIPPNCVYKDKYVLLINEDAKEIGIADLIKGYPDKNTGFLGLLLLKENCQKTGIGKSSYLAIEKYAKNLNLQKIRLAVVKNNPVEGFWLKMGFKSTGEIKPYKGKNLISEVLVMEKLI